MAEIYVPGAIDIMGSANQMMQFRNSQQAQQANALQMQYTMEDRARADQARKVAAGNALADQARKRELLEIYGNYGATPAPGGTGAPYDPYATLQNKLLQKGFASQAGDIAELQNKNLTGEKTAAEIAGQKATTTGIDYKNTADFIKMTNAQIDAAPNLDALKAIVMATHTPGHPMAAFNKLNNLTPEAAIAGIDDLVAQGKTFEQIRAQMSQGATAAAKHFADLESTQATAKSTLATAAQTVAETKATDEKRTAPLPTEIDIGGEKIFVDMNPNSPTFKQKLTNFVKTLTPNEVATNTAEAKKLAWERANPEYTLQETAQGLVAVNKRNPNNVKPVQLDGQTLMPSVKPGVTVNTGEKGTENTIKKGGEITLANYQTLKSVPRSIASLETVKKLILMPGTKDMLGGGASVLVDVANTLNNRLGTNINVKGLTNAVEIRSRLFEGVVARLKQMDSQPSERQQAALAEALGNIDTDPDALARVVDVWIEEMKDKVKTHNALITKQVKSGDTAIGDYTIDLQETAAAAPTVSNWK